MAGGEQDADRWSVRLDGNAIRLRDLRMGDLEDYAHWHRPGHLWQHFDAPYLAGGVDDIDDRVARLRVRIAQREFATPRTRMVIADRATDAFIGEVSRYWESRETNWASVGIVIYDPASWGRGLGYEALGLWCDYLLEALPEWVRIGCATWSGNPRMMRLAEKLGMRQEACHRMARCYQGQYYDALGYGILRTEWAARYPGGFRAELSGRPSGSAALPDAPPG
jgi:putative hydrolase of HD superfamily